MTEFTLSQQKDIIDDIIDHLENGMMGLAIARDWNYQREGNIINFKLKEGHTVNLETIFWFGYFTTIK